MRATVSELENAVRVFSQLSAASNLQLHGFDDKKINTHVEYCKHLLEAAKVHREAAEREEQQKRHRDEAARQVALAEEARRKAEEQKKYLVCYPINYFWFNILIMNKLFSFSFYINH